MTKITEKENIMTQEELEETTPTPPTEAEPTPEPTEPAESGITLPDDAVAVEQMTSTDRLLAFDADGNPVTATAEQVKTFATEGFVSIAAMEEALERKAEAPLGYTSADLNELYRTGLYTVDGFGGAVPNGPADSGNCRVIVISGHENRTTQIAQMYESDRMFFRRKNEGLWSPWVELWHSGNFDPTLYLKRDVNKPATMALDDEETIFPEVSIRAQRSAQYQMQTDELLYDALEAFARNHPEYTEFAGWLAAKDRIRAELSKHESQEGGE